MSSTLSSFPRRHDGDDEPRHEAHFVVSLWFTTTAGNARLSPEVRLVRLKQPLDDFATDEVLVNDLGYVVDGDVAVPDLLGVDDDADSVRALVKATGVVRADNFVKAACRQLRLQPIANFGAVFGLAAALGIVGRAIVDADKHVTLKARHRSQATTFHRLARAHAREATVRGPRPSDLAIGGEIQASLLLVASATALLELRGVIREASRSDDGRFLALVDGTT